MTEEAAVDWLRQGPQFDLLELDVVAGAGRGFRLRPAALRRSGGRLSQPGVVAHEHHSFPMVDTAS